MTDCGQRLDGMLGESVDIEAADAKIPCSGQWT